jgi:hypothetical protein
MFLTVKYNTGIRFSSGEFDLWSDRSGIWLPRFPKLGVHNILAGISIFKLRPVSIFIHYTSHLQSCTCSLPSI